MKLTELVNKIYGEEIRPDYFIQFTEGESEFFQQDYLDELLETHGDKEVEDYATPMENLLVVRFSATIKEEEQL